MPSIENLNYISLQFAIYSGLLVFFAGIIGNIFNVLVFLSLKTFRENSCAFYLTAMSSLNICQLLLSLLPRILNLWFTIDWTVSSTAYCKARMYLFQVGTLTSFSCMCLATIDQYLATCAYPRLQRFSSIKFAYRFFQISICICILHGIPLLIYQNRYISPTTGEYICAIMSTAYQYYYTYGFTLIYISSLPCLLTVVFGLVAYHNVQQLAYRTVPLIRRELDKQLTVMVLVEIAFNFCVLVPYIIAFMINLSANVNKNSYSYAQIQLARNITITLFYLYYACPFYIYICVSERFRRQFIHVLFGLYIKHRQRRMTIHPIVPIS